ncbi:polyketide cyclase [Maribacter algarum]|uniref:Polyketide cyclase n=1 Tax=Maribacter algarum (ex Zhang et al. 2020) TaxID=2578118 RepID=A0A5S3QM00_9FLAO|nr:SRPBCC family protein [Maribacter algarum]TMM58924.1 polyketide cyclase [Maribacter algarum]
MKRLKVTLVLLFMATIGNSQEVTQTNKHFSNTTETKASPNKIWKIWTDVPNWKIWDSGLKDANLDGAFELNEKGKITSLEGKTSSFKIVSFEQGKSYTFKSNLPLGSLYVKRYLSITNDGTTFTHEVWFKGLTGGLFAKKFGPKFREMLPQVMQNIKKLAEE